MRLSHKAGADNANADFFHDCLQSRKISHVKDFVVYGDAGRKMKITKIRILKFLCPKIPSITILT